MSISPAKKYRIVFMGTPDFAVPILAALATVPWCELVGVYTQPDRVRGRGTTRTPSPVKRYATKLSLPVFEPTEFRSANTASELTALEPDCIIVAAFGHILPHHILSIPRFGCVNMHASLLPRYRGAAPIQAVILAGERETGITLMQMSRGMDEGPILLQQPCAITSSDTALTLSKKLSTLGSQMMLRFFPDYFEQKITPILQDESAATYTKTLRREDGCVRWETEDAEHIERKIRAYIPWPSCFTFFKKNGTVKTVKFLRAAREVTSGHGVPGTCAGVQNDALSIITTKSILLISALQVEGKGEISGSDFFQGYVRGQDFSFLSHSK